MYKIFLLPEMENSIFDIVEYISNDNLFYANRVHEYIKKSIYLLGDFPFLGRLLDDKIHRQIVEPKYKFKIIYKVEGKIIYIIAMFREQESWK